MTDSPTKQLRFLVIKLGGLDEFVQATGAFKAIHERHKDHHLTLLTTEPYVEWARRSGYFNRVWEDSLTPPWNVRHYLAFLRALREERFSGVYDLQCSRRTEWYFRLMGKKKPDWSGHISWCSHPHMPLEWERLHLLDRQAGQLAEAGIPNLPPLDVSFITADISGYVLPPRYALLFPAGAPYQMPPRVMTAEGREIALPTRWSDVGFVEVARWLERQEITPVFIGSPDEKQLVDEVEGLCAGIKVVNLAGKVGFGEIAELARRAVVTIGNDTEPMWLVAATGCKTVFAFPGFSDYKLRVPRGRDVRVIAENDLAMLPAREVIRLAGELLALDTSAESAKQTVAVG